MARITEIYFQHSQDFYVLINDNLLLTLFNLTVIFSIALINSLDNDSKQNFESFVLSPTLKVS